MHSFALVVPLVVLASLGAQRPGDPVVLEGRELSGLTGKSPARIVAFAWHGQWRQVPVQIDERAVVSFAQIRKNNKLTNTALVYTDPKTFTGADPNASFDADDELVLDPEDAGQAAGFGDPKGVLPATRTTLLLTDPLSRSRRFVYLFESDGSLRGDAGQDRVAYTFKLLSGDYLSTYQVGGGRNNPEQSVMGSAVYRVGFTERWVWDSLQILAGTGVDVLDRDKFQFAPGNCNRTTDTFSLGGGAIIANVDGPLRAIRSVVGANSGTTTQRDWVAYERRLDVVTHLRVHAIGATWWFLDYSAAASGMTYRDSLNTAGVVIDGAPDNVTLGRFAWQLVTGVQGSQCVSFLVATDIPSAQIQWSSYYSDDLTPSWNQCTGDAFAYGACGPTTGGLPNTDPLRGPANSFVSTRVHYLGAPGWGVTEAAQFDQRARQPWQAQVLEDFATIGAGCAGSVGLPQLEMAGSALLGETLRIRVSPLATPSAGLLHLGLSSTQSVLGPLPLDLSALGMPGCFLRASLDVPLTVVATAGRLDVALPVPASPGLAGLRLYPQLLYLDTQANAAGLHLSSAGRFRIEK